MKFIVQIGLLLLMTGYINPTNARELSFKHLVQNELLPSAHVNQITQLSQGFMLFSTTSGVRLFDGHKLIEFKVKDLPDISPLNSNVYAAVQDSHGNIWFATSLGLYWLSVEDNRLRRVSHNPQDSNSLIDDNVRVIIEDKQQNLWFGTLKGVSRFDSKSNKFTHYSDKDSIDGSESQIGMPSVLLQQNQDIFWFGTSTGLYQINTQSGQFQRVDGPIGKAYVTSGIITDDEHIWFATHGLGIFKYNLSGQLLANLTQANNPELGLHSDQVWKLFEDDTKKIWMSYWANGLSVYDPKSAQVYHGVYRQGDKSALPNKYIQDIYADDSGLIWIASTTGIATFNPINFNIQTLSHIPQDHNSIGNGAIFAIEESANDVVWLGTENGIERWSRQDNSIVHYYHDPANNSSITPGIIWDLQLVGDDHLMAATDKGIDVLDIATGQFSHYRNIYHKAGKNVSAAFYSIVPKSEEWFYITGTDASVFLFNPISGERELIFAASEYALTADVEYFTSILPTANGDLWIGSTTGLFQYQPQSNYLVAYSTIEPINRLSDNYIYDLVETADGSIWVATANGGINKIDIYKTGDQHLSIISKKQGLPSNRVHTLGVDKNNHIWFVSNKHFGSLTIKDNHITSYSNLKSNERGFREGALKLGENNTIYLGDSRLRVFQRDVLQTSHYMPQVRITGVNHVHQPFAGFSPLKEQQAIEFYPVDTLVSFEFASLDFASPELNQYRYKLVGHDDKWFYPGNENKATYTQLPANQYQLIIQGTNRDGLWSPHMATLDIVMHPPFYRSAWAYFVYLASALLMAAFILNWRKNNRKIELANMQMIKQSEARLKDVLWGSGDVLWRWELSNNKIYKTDNANLNNEHQETVVDFQSHMAKLHPDDQQSTQDRIDRHLNGEEDYYEAQYRMLNPDTQDWTWMLARGRVVEFDENGAPLVISGTLKNIDAIKQTEKQLRYLADYDQLTGLPNRTLFHKHLNHSIETAKRYKEKVALLYLDLNEFKAVNDTLGHAVGDQLLKAVANRLTKALRKIDRCSRLSGDEFAIIVERVASADEVIPSLERIIEEVARPFLLNQQTVMTSVSIGIAIYPDNAQRPTELLKHADFAMYEAKRDSKKHYQFFNEQMNAIFIKRLSIENELKIALKEQQFETFYQPRVSVLDNSESGFEALIRWRHPSRGLVSPAEFIPVAEESGLILDIGEWVLKDGCRQASEWYQQGWRGFVSINIAALQFQQADLVNSVKSALAEFNLPSACLELEITESTLINDIELTRNILFNLKKLGVKIALDDFGTGYSSLSYLQQLPLDVLKIDRTFINLIPDSLKSKRLCTAIINMAHSLDLKVVAEGIELEEQLAFLREVFCEEYQGYLFAKPQAAEDIVIKKSVN